MDVAPLANSQAPAYLSQYEAKGAHAVTTDVVDLLTLLWAPTSVLADSAKAAAVAAYIPYWAKGQVWAYENPDIWNEQFYVKTQNLTLAQAKAVTALANKPLFPPSWGEAITWEQETADLLAAGGFVKKFDVGDLFDHRFEGIAAKSVAAEYRR
ncbi:ABC-type nitrate/sulfonate/bicarbonate transport system substrate-binding protein [Streptomyces canus]|nr:ABC-type nitrate/sulfonate/bicarbonate transport system substrate-binding protein [Streptomyces canus]